MLNNVLIRTLFHASFSDDDLVELRRGSHLRRFYRISGNYSTASVGWCEDVQLEAMEESESFEAEEVSELMGLMSNGLVRATRAWRDFVTDQQYDPPPLTVAVRFLLLELILRVFFESNESRVLANFCIN